jgi:ribulose-5-phosphate 4-epimerase/fuculose-1-phosphate aldolase
MKNIEKLMNDLLMINSELYQKGYITPTGGNISVRGSDEPEKVVITPSQIYKKDLVVSQLLVVDLNGTVVNDVKIKPSTETPIHLAIYRARPDINAVIHTHTINTTIFCLTGLDFLPITAEAVMLRGIPTINWTSGTMDAGEQVAGAIGKKGYFVQIQNHGLVVAGPSLHWAAGITDMIETQCKMLVACKMMGITPKALPKEVAAAIISSAEHGGAVG